MTIIQGAGFTISPAQRSLSDLYCVAVKFDTSTYCVISPIGTLAGARAFHGRNGQVILKFPQGYEEPAVEWSQWRFGLWSGRYVGELQDTYFQVVINNVIGHPDVVGVTLDNSNLIECGFTKSSQWLGLGDGSQSNVQMSDQVDRGAFWYSDGSQLPEGWYDGNFNAPAGDVLLGLGVVVQVPASEGEFIWFV